MNEVELGKTALRKAIDAAGSQTALAEQLRVTQQAVSYWLTTPGARIPPEHCGAIERLTGTPRAQLWPELFGEAAA